MSAPAPHKLVMTPASLAAGIGALLLLLGAATLFAWAVQAHGRHHWWPADDILSFALPFGIALAAQIVLYVPYRLEWDETHLTVGTWLGGDWRAPWSALRHWGSPGLTFSLDYEGSLDCEGSPDCGKSFRIALNYFTPESVASFRDFLDEHFADRQAVFRIGNRGID